MKNNRIVIVVVLMICISTICCLYIYYNLPINENIKGISWYNYNIKEGIYNELKIDNDSITFYYINSNQNCTKYNYNTKLKNIVLDCGITIHIKEVKDNYIVLVINNEENVFFKSPEETLNYEFEKFYEESIIEYTNSKKQVEEILKISVNKLKDIINQKDTSILVFKGNGCNNIDCTLLLGVLEKWNVDSQNVYYIDSSYFNEDTYNYLKSLNNKFDNYNSYYNSNYPFIIKLSNNVIVEGKEFTCNGFDCTFWKNYSN
jgi:hypothetical protein